MILAYVQSVCLGHGTVVPYGYMASPTGHGVQCWQTQRAVLIDQHCRRWIDVHVFIQICLCLYYTLQYLTYDSGWGGRGGHGGGRRGQFALHWFCVYNLVCVCHRLPFWNFVKWTRPEQHIDPEFSVVTYIFKAETHFILLKCNFFTVNTKLQSTTVGSKLRLWKDAKVLCCFFFFFTPDHRENLKIASCHAQRACSNISWLICLLLSSKVPKVEATLRSLSCPSHTISRDPSYL